MYFGNGVHGALHAGDNDLGELTLCSTGSISGRVIDPAGIGLGGAFVWVGFGGNELRYGEYTDPQGNFLIAHILPGSYSIEASGDSFARRRIDDVSVQPAVSIQGVNFELEPALSITGVVVDDAGVPLVGATLFAMTDRSISNSSVRSAEDGSFTILLDWNEPSRIRGVHEEFAQRLDQTVFALGARNVLISMERMPRWTFRVVDAQTKLPIERFYAEVCLGEYYYEGGSYALPAPRHPGGTVERALRAGHDTVVFIAEGRLSKEVDIDPKTLAGSTIVVEL
jgi:hypothetical protein